MPYWHFEYIISSCVSCHIYKNLARSYICGAHLQKQLLCHFLYFIVVPFFLDTTQHNIIVVSMESDPLPTGIIIIDLRDEEERLMQEIAISKEKMNEAGGKGYILPLLKFNVLQKMA